MEIIQGFFCSILIFPVNLSSQVSLWKSIHPLQLQDQNQVITENIFEQLLPSTSLKENKNAVPNKYVKCHQVDSLPTQRTTRAETEGRCADCSLPVNLTEHFFLFFLLRCFSLFHIQSKKCLFQSILPHLDKMYLPDIPSVFQERQMHFKPIYTFTADVNVMYAETLPMTVFNILYSF